MAPGSYSSVELPTGAISSLPATRATQQEPPGVRECCESHRCRFQRSPWEKTDCQLPYWTDARSDRGERAGKWSLKFWLPHCTQGPLVLREALPNLLPPRERETPPRKERYPTRPKKLHKYLLWKKVDLLIKKKYIKSISTGFESWLKKTTYKYSPIASKYPMWYFLKPQKTLKNRTIMKTGTMVCRCWIVPAIYTKRLVKCVFSKYMPAQKEGILLKSLKKII